MSTFREAIARAVDEYEYARHVQAAIAPDSADLADAVLAMPEMEAIRKALHHFARTCAFARGDDMDDLAVLRWHLGIQMPDAPNSVIAWVLGGDQ